MVNWLGSDLKNTIIKRNIGKVKEQGVGHCFGSCSKNFKNNDESLLIKVKILSELSESNTQQNSKIYN